MPSINMKSNQSASCLRETTNLHVCQKSNVISKKSCCSVKNFLQATEFGPCIQEFQSQDAFPVVKVSNQVTATDAFTVDDRIIPEENFQRQKMESNDTCSKNSQTIFSPVLEQPEILNEPKIENRADSNNNPDAARPITDDNDNRSSCDYQTSNISDFSSSNMIIASVPFEEDNSWMYYILNDNCTESNMLFDVDGQFMFLPQLEDFAENNSSTDPSFHQESEPHPNNEDLYAILDEMRSINRQILISDSDQESVDPYSIKNVPQVSDMVSNLEPAGSPKETQRRKPVTLVLDLDETLVHSTSQHSDDADFSFTVVLDMTEQTVYVKKRPHLQTFLERVADMFEVVIFTASLSVYAEQLLDILDPDRKLISRRAYRDSCILTDGIYTKDLTILGVDLAKVAIIDNSPQVFRLQVNNGIPIESWFDDPTDSALISLLPFLETLANAEDVRPLIAEKFGNKE